MQEPIWNNNSPEHIELHKKYIKEANGYCLECQRPLTYVKHYLCKQCVDQLKLYGLESDRVPYKTVGQITINYQQSIHRRFFKCNAPYEYRGIATDRIKTTISSATLSKSCNILEQSILSMPDCNTKLLYTYIKDLRNCNKRLLYATLLYSIAYYIEKSPEFKHQTHYQASVVKQLENDIQRMYIRTHYYNKDIVKPQHHKSLKVTKELYRIINTCVSPLLLECL